jgi:hypothetical protein
MSHHMMLKKIILDDPAISEAEAKEKLWEMLQGDPQRYFRLLYDNWFNANWHRYEPEIKEIVTERPGQPPIIGHSITIIRKHQRASQERKAKRKVVAKSVIEYLAQGFVLPKWPFNSERAGCFSPDWRDDAAEKRNVVPFVKQDEPLPETNYCQPPHLKFDSRSKS